MSPPANEQARAQVDRLAQAVQAATGQSVELAYVDQGSTSERVAADATDHGIHRGEAARGVPQLRAPAPALGRRAVVERLPETVRGLRLVAFACPLLSRAMLALLRGS